MRRRFFYLRVTLDIDIPDNEIWYTSSTGDTIFPYRTSDFDATITSNTYVGNKGIICFDGPITKIGSRAFYTFFQLTSIEIPNSVTSIGQSAFAGCSGLTSIEIPNSVTSIGNGAFEDCSGLTSVTIGNSVTIIGAYAFSDCKGLTSVTIPNSVTSIYSYAFENCSGLISITIPNSVTLIGSSAFYGCSGLTEITCKAVTPPTIRSGTFTTVDTSIPVYVPAESVDAYKSAQYWSVFTNIQAIVN